MPQPVVGHSGAVPTRTRRVEDLVPYALEKSLEKKMKGTVVYGALVADKISTKWKKQRRMVLVTANLVLVCHTDGNVRRVVDLCDLSDIMVQPEGTNTYILFKLGRTEANEPDLLLCSTIDTKNRNSHDPIGFADQVNLIARARNPTLTDVKHLAQNGPIRSLTRLGHNTVSAREKIKMCGVRQTPLSIPASAPTSAPSSAPPSAPQSPVHSAVSEPRFEVTVQPHQEDKHEAAFAEFTNDEDVIRASRMRANSVVVGANPETSSEFVKKLQESEQGSQRARAVSFTMPKPVERIVAEPEPITNAKAHGMPPVKTLPEDDEGGCGWTEHKDPVTQLTYYHNDKEGRSTWHEPEELKAWKHKTGYISVTSTKQKVTLTESVDSDTTAEASSSDSDSDSSVDGFGPVAAKKPVTSLKQISSLLDGPAVRVSSRPFEPPAFETHPIEDLSPPAQPASVPLAFRGAVSNAEPVRRHLARPPSVQSASRGANIQNCIPDFQEIGLNL